MKCFNCGMEYDDILGKCPYCLQREPSQASNPEPAVPTESLSADSTPPYAPTAPVGPAPSYVSPEGSAPPYTPTSPAYSEPPYASPAGSVPPYVPTSPTGYVPPYASPAGPVSPYAPTSPAGPVSPYAPTSPTGYIPPYASTPPTGYVPPYASTSPTGYVPPYAPAYPADSAPPYARTAPAGPVPPYAPAYPADSAPPFVPSPSAGPTPPYTPVPPVYNPPSDAPPQKKKKTAVLIGVGVGAGVLVLAIVAAAVIWFLVDRYRENAYQEQMDLGFRYLEQGNYEEARLAFEAALDIRPKRGEPHVGIGDTYTAMGSYVDARDSYERALDLDDSLADAYLGLANACLELGDTDGAMAALENGFAATGDVGIEEWLETMRNMSGTAAIQGTVSEYLPGGGSAPLPGARVRLYSTGTNESRLLRAITTDGNGAFSLTDLGSGTVSLRVDAVDHIGLVASEELLEGAVNYTELYLLIPSVDGGTASSTEGFYATITNAINGEGVSGAEVRLREGWNNTDGGLATPEIFFADDYGGIYVQGLNYGYYTAEVQADGFLTSFHNVSIIPDEFYAEWILPMSPRLAEGETRIVLTWGELPYDLDSHLYNDDFHVYFNNRDYYSHGDHLVNLDWDDTFSYGPETVTIYQPLGNDCTYYVLDYSNWGISSSEYLCSSGAMVRVYQSDGLAATFHVPTGIAGDRWIVFTLTADGRIIPINTIDMETR